MARRRPVRRDRFSAGAAARAHHPRRDHPRTRPSRDALLATLEAHDWSIRATARQYTCKRKQITRWIGMYAIIVPDRDA